MNKWLIWSIEHGMWWKAGQWGYTKKRSEAGRYSFDEACGIVYSSNKYKRDIPDEAMIKDEK
jgi:hypothetical protein